MRESFTFQKVNNECGGRERKKGDSSIFCAQTYTNLFPRNPVAIKRLPRRLRATSLAAENIANELYESRYIIITSTPKIFVQGTIYLEVVILNLHANRANRAWHTHCIVHGAHGINQIVIGYTIVLLYKRNIVTRVGKFYFCRDCTSLSTATTAEPGPALPTQIKSSHPVQCHR